MNKIWILILTAVLSFNAEAADKKGKKAKGNPAFTKLIAELKLTKEQKPKVQALQKEQRAFMAEQKKLKLEDVAMLDKNKISSQIKIAKRQDKIPNMIYCGTCKIFDKKVISEEIPQFKGQMIEFIFNGFSLPSSCMLMTKESIMSIGGHSEELISCIDHDIWMNMSLNGFEMDFAPEVSNFSLIKVFFFNLRNSLIVLDT